MKQGQGNTIEDLVAPGAAPCSQQLAQGTDITHKLLAIPEPSVEPKPASSIAFQKAALITFQTWSSRTPKISGILLGGRIKNESVCHSVIVSESMKDLLADEKVDFVCKSEQLQIMGIIIPGCCEDQQDVEVAMEQFDLARNKEKCCSACVFASRMV